MKIKGTILNAHLQIGEVNYRLDVLYVTPESHSFFIMGADIFHETRIYRTGINDRERTLDLAYDNKFESKTITTQVRFRMNAPPP